jgi:hypothetical protein
MTTFNDKFLSHKEALKENFEAIDLLLKYDKSIKKDLWGEHEGCLGYAALILIFTQINTFGHLMSGKEYYSRKINTDKSTFSILNSEYFNEQKLDTEILDELYTSFRSLLIHNLALPQNFYIKRKSKNGLWYELGTGKNNKKIITTIYLNDLNDLCRTAYKKFELLHEENFHLSKKFKEITNKDIIKNINETDVEASGSFSL